MALKSIKCKSVTALNTAKTQHQKWVEDVLSDPIPHVEADHTQCDFGKWLLSAEEELRKLPEFDALDDPHRKLHMAYLMVMTTPGLDRLELETKHYSKLLIERIEALKSVLEN